jgi:hypothetical protein
VQVLNVYVDERIGWNEVSRLSMEVLTIVGMEIDN